MEKNFVEKKCILMNIWQKKTRNWHGRLELWEKKEKFQQLGQEMD